MPLLAEYGRWPINALERTDFAEYLQGLTYLAYTTRQKHQAIVQALLNFAVEQEYIKSNPIARLRQPKPDAQQGEHISDEQIRYLTEAQLQCLYQAVASDLRMQAIISLLHRSGARIAEVLNSILMTLILSLNGFRFWAKEINNDGVFSLKIRHLLSLNICNVTDILVMMRCLQPDNLSH